MKRLTCDVWFQQHLENVWEKASLNCATLKDQEKKVNKLCTSPRCEAGENIGQPKRSVVQWVCFIKLAINYFFYYSRKLISLLKYTGTLQTLNKIYLALRVKVRVFMPCIKIGLQISMNHQTLGLMNRVSCFTAAVPNFHDLLYMHWVSALAKKAKESN